MPDSPKAPTAKEACNAWAQLLAIDIARFQPTLPPHLRKTITDYFNAALLESPSRVPSDTRALVAWQTIREIGALSHPESETLDAFFAALAGSQPVAAGEVIAEGWIIEGDGDATAIAVMLDKDHAESALRLQHYVQDDPRLRYVAVVELPSPVTEENKT